MKIRTKFQPKYIALEWYNRTHTHVCFRLLIFRWYKKVKGHTCKQFIIIQSLKPTIYNPRRTQITINYNSLLKVTVIFIQASCVRLTFVRESCAFFGIKLVLVTKFFWKVSFVLYLKETSFKFWKQFSKSLGQPAS